MKIPFKFTLSNFILKGKPKQIAEAHHNLSGEKLERRLIDIDFDDKTTKEYILKSLDLDKKYNKISNEEYDMRVLNLKHDDKTTTEYMLDMLEFNKKYNKISDIEYAKEKSIILKEPWVAYKDYGLENADGKTGFWFELDWNEFFVNRLRSEGYDGDSDEKVVKRWYSELCRTVAIEEGLALDLFADEEPQSGIKKIRRDDGTVDYS